MKRYLAAIVFSACMSMQPLSAATLTLTQDFGDGSIVVGKGATVSGTTTIGAVWTIVLSDLGTSGLADLTLNLTSLGKKVKSFFDVDPITGLSAGEYSLAIIGHTVFSITATDVDATPTGQTPVPSAVWLFGSALLGMLGALRFKASSGFAA